MNVDDGGKGKQIDQSQSTHTRNRATKLEKRVLTDMTVMEEASRYREWVKGPLDIFVAIVVIMNFVWMAAWTQEVGHTADVSLGVAKSVAPSSGVLTELYRPVDVAFCAIYLIDVLARMLVLRREWLYDEVDGFMFTNVFDLFLVSVHLLEIVLANSGSAYQQVSALRVWKLLRLVLSVRIIKTVNLFRQLRVLISACVSSLSALFWSLVLMLLLTSPVVEL